MRKLIFAAIIVVIVACKVSRPVPVAPSAIFSPTNVTLPYGVSYSSQFEMTNHKYSGVVMNIWRNWDNNTMDNVNAYFADTVRMQLEGDEFSAQRDSFMTMSKQQRARYQTVRSDVSAIFSFKSIDKNNDWVSIYGVEHTEDLNGKKDSTDMHEIWLFNKQGKISFLCQYPRKFSNQ